MTELKQKKESEEQWLLAYVARHGGRVLKADVLELYQYRVPKYIIGRQKTIETRLGHVLYKLIDEKQLTQESFGANIELFDHICEECPVANSSACIDIEPHSAKCIETREGLA
jgi:hypothetical protein